MIRHCFFFIFLIASLTSVAKGVSFESYKSRVEGAWVLAYETENALKEYPQDTLTVGRFVAAIRRDFPRSESIDWPGAAVETSHDWLLNKIGSLEAETDAAKRRGIVTEVREYLASITYKLQETAAAMREGTSKDEEKRKLADILRREEFQKPVQKQESAFQKWLREFLEWIESLFPKAPATAPRFGGTELLAFVLQIVLIVGSIGILLFLLYRLVTYIFPNLKPKKKAKKKSRVILGEQIAEDQTPRGLFTEAERLAREGDLRGAIRKGYIALLCELSDRRIIGLARHKTNRDYLRDVRSLRELHPRMKDVTETFERNWYGSQGSDEQAWTRFREQYNDAIRSV